MKRYLLPVRKLTLRNDSAIFWQEVSDSTRKCSTSAVLRGNLNDPAGLRFSCGTTAVLAIAVGIPAFLKFHRKLKSFRLVLQQDAILRSQDGPAFLMSALGFLKKLLIYFSVSGMEPL